MDSEEKYIGTIYEDTDTTKFMVFSTKSLQPIASDEINIDTFSPQEGWFEQNPMEILNKVKETIDVTCDKLMDMNISVSSIVSIGVTNQRDTTILWDRITGKPLYNAITWRDLRTTTLLDRCLNSVTGNFETLKDKLSYYQHKSGLTANPFYSGFKLLWLIENIPGILEAVNDFRCMYGTIDSWIIWNLTGGKNGGAHMMDVTNASRTMLMNINSLQWDATLFEFFQIPAGVYLPHIKSSSEVYGSICNGPLLGIPIAGCIVDNQSSNVGQMCFVAGQAKLTIQNGLFLSYNTGKKPVMSSTNLLSTVAYKMGPNTNTVYTIEGFMSLSPNAPEWLMQKLEIAENHEKQTNTASIKQDSNGVRVPAFNGIYAPCWKKNGRLTGLPLERSDCQLMKSTLQTICYQTKDTLKTMNLDAGHTAVSLNVDGVLSTCDTFLQSLANICRIPVVRSNIVETVPFGAALAAGIAVDIWRMHTVKVSRVIFLPGPEVVNERRVYNQNVVRAIRWNTDEEEEHNNETDES